MRITTLQLPRLTAALAAGLFAAVWHPGVLPASSTPNTGMADPAALISAFDRFLAGAPANPPLSIPLVALRGLTEPVNASGAVIIDMATGSVVSQVRGLPAC